MTMNEQRQHTVIRMATVLLLLSTAIVSQAQTSAFTYQGRLSDGGTAANGTYDLQFSLFDSLAGGAQVGSTQTISSVAVSSGIFSVQLDFGAGAFTGPTRFLEIAARLSGAQSFTTLAPRQPITSTPYAIRSLNAASADAVTVSGVPVGSGNYIQNTTSPQTTSNFNISGNGTAGGTLSAGAVNATTQYNIGGNRVLSNPGTNLFAGGGAGANNTAGDFNAFFGRNSGQANTTGINNAFFGDEAGRDNCPGNCSGIAQGKDNAFFGAKAGKVNVIGYYNSFFGSSAGAANMFGTENSYFGFSAGGGSTGSFNSFFGTLAGSSNTTGNANTLFGFRADVGSGNLINASAIGAYARVDVSNAMVLGSINGVNGAIASVNVGIGTTTPQATLDVNGTTLLRGGATITGTNGDGAVLTARRPTGDPYIIIDATTVAQNSVLAFRKSNFNRWLMYTDATPESGGNAGSDFRLDAYNNSGGIANYLTVTRATGQLSISGKLKLDQIDSGLGQGTVQLCRNPANVIATCSSSLRYKQGITPFSGGLDLIRRLRPISFTWKIDGSRDLGLGAEDVAKVEPLLVTHNDKGEIEGVKYDHLNVVLINAIKEQQRQIEELRREVQRLRIASRRRSRRA